MDKCFRLLNLSFGGILENNIKCKHCLHESLKCDAFLDLSLAINKDTLDECLEQYFVEEELSTREAYFCGQCNSLQTAIKSLKILKCPKYLIIHLKRLLPGQRKITKMIKYSKDLILTKYCTNKNEGKYELQAVCVHSGGGSSGHFITFAKRTEEVLLYYI